MQWIQSVASFEKAARNYFASPDPTAVPMNRIFSESPLVQVVVRTLFNTSRSLNETMHRIQRFPQGFSITHVLSSNATFVIYQQNTTLKSDVSGLTASAVCRLVPVLHSLPARRCDVHFSVGSLISGSRDCVVGRWIAREHPSKAGFGYYHWINIENQMPNENLTQTLGYCPEVKDLPAFGAFAHFGKEVPNSEAATRLITHDFESAVGTHNAAIRVINSRPIVPPQPPVQNTVAISNPEPMKNCLGPTLIEGGAIAAFTIGSAYGAWKLWEKVITELSSDIVTHQPTDEQTPEQVKERSLATMKQVAKIGALVCSAFIATTSAVAGTMVFYQHITRCQGITN